MPDSCTNAFLFTYSFNRSILESLKKEYLESPLNFIPTLAILRSNDQPDSTIYIQKKQVTLSKVKYIIIIRISLTICRLDFNQNYSNLNKDPNSKVFVILFNNWTRIAKSMESWFNIRSLPKIIQMKYNWDLWLIQARMLMDCILWILGNWPWEMEIFLPYFHALLRPLCIFLLIIVHIPLFSQRS